MMKRTGITASFDHSGFELLPREVKRFFTENAGQSLLVTGAPGTGKTLFTLRVLDSLARGPDEALYVSSRIDEDAIQRLYLGGYPSLDRTNVLDLSRDPFDTPMDVEFLFDDLSTDTFLDWVRSVNDVSHGLVLAFDSWELIQESLSRSPREQVEDEVLVERLATLARREEIDLLLVVEDTAESSLEYITDGVARLHVDENDTGQTIRTLRLEKLRGVHIGNRSKPFSLVDGRYRSFSPIQISAIRAATGTEQWEPTSGTKSTFATGIDTLDTLLSDGYNRGSVVHAELGPDLPRDAWTLVTLPTIRNFLAQERGVAVVPPRETSPGLLQGDLSAAVSPEVFERFCAVFVPPTGINDTTEDGTSESEWLVSRGEPDGQTDETRTASGKGLRDGIHNRGLDYAAYLAEVERIRPPDDGPVLHAFSTEAMDERIESQLDDFAQYVTVHNDLALIVTKPGSELRSRTDRVADVHLQLEREEETILLSGQNPFTPLLGVGIDTERCIPRIVLLEMV
jgi:KaiC/GvpD/RAD55 family RecA-like ATPase